MTFDSFILTETGVVSAKAVGHPTEVLSAFHNACTTILSGRGAWRITEAVGSIDDGTELESEMSWTLQAKLKT